jgi:hypothetical protein
MKANNILETIGNTPHVWINKLFNNEHEVWLKLERNNPGASIKADGWRPEKIQKWKPAALLWI